MARKFKPSQRGIDTTTGNLAQIIPKLAIPAALQAMLVNFYAFNDFVFVGLLNDKDATAALSACFAVLVIQYSTIRIMPTGGTTLVAQYSGAHDLDSVGDTCRQTLFVSIIWSCVVGAIGLSILPWIISASNVTPTVGTKISEYLGVLFWASPAFALMIVSDGTFQARGDTKTPLYLEIMSLIVNTFLNWVLVLGNLGFEPMGIKGAAIATALCRAIPGLISYTLIYFGSLNFELAAPLSRWIPRRKRLYRMFRIGLFDSLGSILYGFTYMALNRLAGEISSAAQGGLGAGLRGIEWIGFSIGDGFRQTALVLVGQNLGAQQYDRAKKAVWYTGIGTYVSSQLVGFAFILFPKQLCYMVTQDPETLTYAATYISICGWVQGLCSFEMTIYGALIGAGRSVTTFIISGLGNIVRIPIAAFALFGITATASATAWAYFGVGYTAPLLGSFSGICWAIASTTIFKSATYLGIITFTNPFDSPIINVKNQTIELEHEPQ